MRVRNTSATDPVAPHLVLRVREGGHEPHVLARRDLATIAPGRLGTYRLAVTLPRFPATRFVVDGQLDGAGGSARFTVGTAVVPWGLLLDAALAVQLVLLGLRNRLRRRLFGRRHLRVETMRAFTKAYRPLVLLDGLDPLQYWVTTWNDVTRRRWRRAVLIEQTAIAARRGGLGQRQLPRGA